MQIVYHILATVGGIGAIIFGLSKFFGNIWANKIKEHDRQDSEVQLERVRQTFSVRRIQSDRFTGSQYDIYLQLWDSLQSLRLAVDALWEHCTKSNIAALARQLRATRKKVDQWSIFFDDQHFAEVRGLFQVLEQFYAGKQQLDKIRSEADLADIPDDALAAELRTQIDENRAYRDRFQQQIESLRRSFHDRLSRLEQLQEA